MFVDVVMSPVTSSVLLVAVLFIVIFIFGFLLSRSGKPSNRVLMTVHKVASVAVLIARARLYFVFSSVHGISGMDIPMLLVGVIAGLLILGAMATGGLISSRRQFPDVVYLLHRLLSVLSLVVSVVALYLINSYSGYM